MGISSGSSGADAPDSFSLYILKGEALGYPAGTYTPKMDPFVVQGTTQPLTLQILKAWLLQSVRPLVGDPATDELGTLFETRGDVFAAFLDKAMAFRQSLT